MIIKKLLIANRGEIASRVISSAQDMGISCVAIYTQDDANSPYVKAVSYTHLTLPTKRIV